MPPPPSYALEDGCGEPTNSFEIPQPAVAPTVTTIVVRGTDPESCKIRRRLRMETLRAKRAAKMNGRRVRQVAVNNVSDTATVSSASTVSTYTLSKDELRRKKNRESAERSRLRKLALIDFLTKQATALSEKLRRLNALNRRLRNGEVVRCAHSPRSGSCSDCDSTDGDLSTISGSSSPHTLNTSFSRVPTGKHNLRARTASALSDDSSASSASGSDRLFADSFPNKRARYQDTTAVEAPFPSSSSRHGATLPGGMGDQQRCAGADALDSYLCPRSTLAAVASLTALFPGEEGGGLSAWANRLDDGFLLDGLLDFDLSEFPLTGLT